MRNLLFAMIGLVCMSLMAHAGSINEEQDAKLMIDAYHYGLGGEDCSDIYLNNSESSRWSTPDKPTLRDRLHERCKDGEKDLIKGREELPSVLEKMKKGKKKQ